MEAAVTRAKGIASEVMIIPLKDTIRTFFFTSSLMNIYTFRLVQTKT